MKDRLTKSAYLAYLKCPREFWLDHHRPLPAGEADTLEHEHRRQEGYAVQQLAKQVHMFKPDGTKIVDFERPFNTADLYARSDVIVTDERTGTIDIYEIKSSASVKEEHYDDVAFQKMVAERSGSEVGRCFIVTLNSEYVRRCEIDPDQLFSINDVTDIVDERMPATEKQANDAIAYLESVPVPSLSEYCMDKKLDCRFIKEHFPDLPEYTVFDINRLNDAKRRQLLSAGIVSVVDVPDDFPLSAKQKIQVAAAKSGEVSIDREEIARRIEQWEYPLHFLDYETFSYAIPQFEGVRPFQQMCFQYSLHTIDRPGCEPRHSYYLSKADEDPPRALTESLKKDLSDRIGTVFVWNESFERKRNAEMAAMFPEHLAFYEELNSKTCDLMKVISDGLFVHPKFKGSASIKNVLPVIVPSLSYASLDIGDGTTASINWFRAVKWETLTEDERKKIFFDLEKYCELDTRAMVEIFNEFRRAVSQVVI